MSGQKQQVSRGTHQPLANPSRLRRRVEVLRPVTGPVEIITPPPADPYLEDPKLRRMRKAEITKDMLAAAKSVHKHYAKAVGTQIQIDVNGRPLVARIERHFHPEVGQVKP